MANQGMWTDSTDELIKDDPAWIPELLRWHDEKMFLMEGTPGAVDITKIVGHGLQSRYAIGRAKAWVALMAEQGYLESILCVPVGSNPCKDRFRQENQDILSAVKHPRFSFEVDLTQTTGVDAWIEDHKTDRAYPLEIGDCFFETFWQRCFDYRACARWMYGSKFIYIFVFNQSYQDDMLKTLDASLGESSKPKRREPIASPSPIIMQPGRPYKKAKRTMVSGQLSLF